MNANFILLHGKDSNRVYRVNVNLITKYFLSEDKSGTCIYGDNKTLILLAAESPEQVDNLINGNNPVRLAPDLP